MEEQHNEVNKAVINIGRWPLSSSYSCCAQSADNWFGAMTQAQRKDALSTLHGSSAASSSNVLQPSDKADLSVPYECLSEVLSEGVLKPIWSKASQLLLEK